MPDGYRVGRMTPGFAGIVLAVTMTAGCGRLPVHLFGPANFVEVLSSRDSGHLRRSR